MAIFIGGTEITNIGKITAGATNVQSVWVGNTQVWPPVVSTPVGWILRSSGVTVNLQDVTYAASIFVIVGSSGTILTSSDGKAWTLQTSGTTKTLLKVRYLNGAFYVVGTDVILRSTNGITWTTVYNSLNNNVLTDVAYGNGVYVAVGYVSASGITKISTNGTSWSSGMTPSGPASAVIYHNGNFVMTGRFEFVDTSTDGTNKTVQRAGTGLATDWAYTLFYDTTSSLYVMGGINFKVLTSSNLTSWTVTSISGGGSFTFERVSKSARDGRYFFFGDNYVVRSNTNITGTLSLTTELNDGTTGDLRAIGGSPAIDVAVGFNGRIYTREI